MSFESFMVDPVTLIYPAYVTDSRNNLVTDWDNATEIDTTGWMAQTNASSSNTELTPSREGTLTEWRLFLRKTISLDNRCRVRYLGDVYKVVGRTHVAKTTQGPHHLEIPLELVEG